MEDEEGYAVLNRQPKQRQPGHPSGAGAQGSHWYPRWIWVALGLAGAGILVLLGAVIALAVWEGSGCKLCPRDWLLHGDKCYWQSKERKAWTRSRDGCSRKSSRMLVIQNQEEMDFIQDAIRDTNQVWAGLKVTPPRGTWTWVDGSHLDQTLFQVLGSAEGSSCGTLKGSRIHSETCDADLKWICQKEAVVI